MLEIGRSNIPNQNNLLAKSVPCNLTSEAVNKLRNISFDSQQFSTSVTSFGVDISLVKNNYSGYPWGSMYTFGITNEGNGKLKVWKGKLRRWGDKVYTASDTIVQFSGTGAQYIIWRFKLSNLTLDIKSTPQDERPPESDDDYIYGVIGKINYLGSSNGFIIDDWEQCGIINAVMFSKADS